MVPAGDHLLKKLQALLYAKPRKRFADGVAAKRIVGLPWGSQWHQVWQKMEWPSRHGVLGRIVLEHDAEREMLIGLVEVLPGFCHCRSILAPERSCQTNEKRIFGFAGKILEGEFAHGAGHDIREIPYVPCLHGMTDSKLVHGAIFAEGDAWSGNAGDWRQLMAAAQLQLCAKLPIATFLRHLDKRHRGTIV